MGAFLLRTSGARALRLATAALCALSTLFSILLVPLPAAATAPQYGWDNAATLLEHDDAVNATKPYVALNRSGTEFLVWMQFDANRNNIWAIPYFPATGWGTRALVESSTQDAIDPRVAVDETGNAVAVWAQYDGTRYNILWNRFQGGSWLGANTLSTTDAGSSAVPQIDVQANGNAMVVWQKHDGTGWNIWARYYVAGSGWNNSGVIDSASNDATGPAVAVDDGGNATAVWQQWNGTSSSFDVWATRYSAGSWGIAIALENRSGNATRPRIAATAGGNATAIWQQLNGSAADIWASSYVAGAGWSNATLLETDDTGEALNPDVGTDDLGDATAVWQQWDGSRFDVLSNRFVVGSGWGTASALESDVSNATAPKVAVDGGGNATAVWLQANGSSTDVVAGRFESGSWGSARLIGPAGASALQVEVAADATGNETAVWQSVNGSLNTAWRARYSGAAATWAAPELLPTAGGDIQHPQISVNPSGTAFAIWTRSDGTRNSIWADRYVEGSGWEGPVLIETNDTGWNDALLPQIVVDRGGNATAAWQQFDGTKWNAWANRYTVASGWGSPRFLQTDATAFSGSPALAVDDNGRVMVVWVYANNIWAARFVPGSGWENPTQINTGGYNGVPDVDVDSSGNAIAVWDCGGGCGIYGNRYVAGTGWGSEFGIATQCSGCGDSHFDPRVDMNGNGNATVVFKGAYQSGDPKHIEARTYSPATGWDSVTDIDTATTYDRGLPQVAVDASGRAVAVWYQSNGSAYHIFANRYTPGSGWSGASVIDNVQTGDAYNPSIGTDDGGNATVVFHTVAGGRYNVSTVRYDVANGWGNQTLVQADASAVLVAVEPAGDATAILHGSDGTRWNAVALRFKAPARPAAPEAPSAIATGTQIALNWTAPDDNGGVNLTRYNIYRGPGANNTTLLANTTNLTYTDTNLTKGQTYFYRISALNPVGEGNLSNASSAMVPRTVPTAPRNLTATFGYATAFLNWTPPSDLGDISLLAYAIYRGTASGSTLFLTNVSGAQLTFTDSNLTNGQVYFYRLGAVNLAGESPFSNETNITPGAAPSAPTSFTGSFGNQSAMLDWSPPADPGGYNVTRYWIYRSTSPNASTVYRNVTAGQLSFNDTNVTNGQIFFYRLRAENALGNSTFSAEVAVTPMTVPSAPLGLVVGFGDQALYLNWSTPTSDGGSPLLKYNIYRGTAPGAEVFVSETPDNATRTYADTGLTNGQRYYYVVRAVNAVGVSAASNEVNEVPKRRPSAPLGLTAGFGDTLVSLNWSAPLDDGGASLTHYRLYRGTSPNSTMFYRLVLAAQPVFDDTNVTNGQTYYYEVSANNSVGEGARSAQTSETPRRVPLAPVLAAATYGDRAVFLNWSAASDGGSPLTLYRVFRGLSSSPTSTLQDLGNATLTYTDLNVSNGVLYFYRIAAFNALGQGDYSNEVSVTPRTRPTAPQSFSLTFGDQNITLNWSAPADDGGAPVLRYNIYRGLSPGGESFLDNTTGPVASFLATGLSNGQAYYFVVSAVNSEGEGPLSVELSETPRRAPDAPGGLSASHGDRYVVVSWSPPTYNGSADITGYRVYRRNSSGGEFFLNSTGAGTTAYNDTGLTNGEAYNYRIGAVNSVGEGPKSGEVSQTPYKVPGAPTSLTANFGNRSVALSWVAPPDWGGASSINYSLFRGNSTANLSWLRDTTATSMTDTGLTNGLAYFYAIAANNIEGRGPLSASASETPRWSPSEPQNLHPAGHGDGYIVLEWDPPADNGSLPILGYYVWWWNGSAAELVDSPGPGVLLTTRSGLGNGADYTFFVVAWNDVGNGTASNNTTERPRGVPYSPFALANVTSGDGYVYLNWSEPDDRGSAISRYVVYRRGPGGDGIFNITFPQRTFNDTGLANGEFYNYSVSAVNAEGEGPESVVHVDGSRRRPDAPGGLTAEDGDTNATLRWITPAFNGGRTILGIDVERSVDAVNWTLAAANLSGAATSYLIQGLSNGQLYFFRVGARNELDTNWSAIVSQTPKRIPDAPRNLTLVAGDRHLNLSWLSPAFDGGGQVTNFSVYRWNGIAWALIANTSAPNYNDTGLLNGTVYRYRVSAWNVKGEGPLSNESSEFPRTIPTAPTGFFALFGNRTVTLGWTAPAYDGSTPILRYTLFVVNCGNGSTERAVNRTNLTFSFTDTSLSNGLAYCYQLSATNLMGEGPRSGIVSERPRTRPTEVTLALGQPSYGDAFVVIAWTPPGDDGGDGLVNYSVNLSIDGGLFSFYGVTNASTVGVNATGLTNGHLYCFTVRVNNTVGWSNDSNPVCETPRRAPGLPWGLVLTPGNGGVQLAWTAPTDRGGLTVDWYVIYRGGTVGNQTFLSNTTNATAAFVDEPLPNGVMVCYRVAAGNQEGEGPATAPGPCTTPRTVPGAPTLAPLTYADNTVILNWVANADNGGAAVSEILVYRQEGVAAPEFRGGFEWPTRSGTNDSAENGHTYTYWVIAVNVAGESAGSNRLTVTPITVPQAPLALVARVWNSTANVSWSAPPYDGSSPITGYEVFRGTTAGDLRPHLALIASNLSFEDRGLPNGVRFYYAVRAVNLEGPGPNATANATPLNLLPVLRGDPPTSVRLDEETNYTFAADDPDVVRPESPGFRFSVLSNYSWITIDPTSGRLALYPRSGTATSRWYNYTVTVRDEAGGPDSGAFSVYVGNSAPVIGDILRDAKPNEPFVAPLNVSDPEYDPFSVFIDNASRALGIEALPAPWRLEWTPLYNLPPTEPVDDIVTITVFATDGIDTSSRTFQIRVRNPPDKPPHINSTFGERIGYSGETVVIDLSAPGFMYDPDDPIGNLSWKIDDDPGAFASMVYDPANLSVTITFARPGVKAVNLTLVDPSGLNHTRPLTIESLGVAPADTVLRGTTLWGSFILVGLVSSAGAFWVVQREVKLQMVPAYMRVLGRVGRELTRESRSFRISGALVAAGSVLLFLEHLLLSLANLTLLQGASANGTPSQPAMLAYLDQVNAATPLDIAGAAVLGAGFVLMGTGLRELRWKDRNSGKTLNVRPAASYMAMAAGLLCVAWVVFTATWRSSVTGSATGDWSAALRGALANPAAGGVTPVPDLSAVAAAVASTSTLWAVSSAVFVAAAACFYFACRGLESSGMRVSGRPLLTLSVVSMIGTVLLAFYSVGAASRATSGATSFEGWLTLAFFPLALGAGAKLVVAPIVGTACFMIMAILGTRMAAAKKGQVYLTVGEEAAVEKQLAAPAAQLPTPVTVPAAAAATAAALAPVPVEPKGLTYLVENVFLLYRDGRAIFSRSVAAPEGMDDPELVGSMLVAVQDFVKDSFKGRTPLDRMSYGDGSILIERGSNLILAVTIFGEPHKDLRESMLEALSKLEANFAGIVEEWDGDKGAFAGAEGLLAPVWLPTTDLTRGDVLLARTSKEVQMISGAEFFQGYIRLKVGVVNNTTSVITGVTVDVDFNVDVLRLHKVEPTGYKIAGTKVLLGVLNTGEKATVAYYFDPQICTSSAIDGLCRYKDHDGKVHMVAMKSRQAEVVCPVFFTKEQANTAMLRRLVETQLQQFDLKAYGLPEGVEAPKLHDLFEAMKSVVLAHDVVLVRAFERTDPYQGEAWLYGKTQKGFEIAIRVLLDAAKGRAEFFAASNAMKSVTGLLAEFHHQFEQVAAQRFAELTLRPLFDEELRAPYEDPQAVSRMVAGEIGPGETEQDA